MGVALRDRGATVSQVCSRHTGAPKRPGSTAVGTAIRFALTDIIAVHPEDVLLGSVVPVGIESAMITIERVRTVPERRHEARDLGKPAGAFDEQDRAVSPDRALETAEDS